MRRKKAKSKKRTYFGEATATPLVELLNAETAAGTPFLGLYISELFNSTADYYHSPNPKIRKSLKDRANKALREFTFSPVIEDVNETWTVHWVPGKDGSRGWAVQLWLKLAELGLLPRLKRCAYLNCRKFFFAKFSHTSFHSIKCRDAAAKDDPTRREKRRAYERRYWRDKNPIFKMKGQ